MQSESIDKHADQMQEYLQQVTQPFRSGGGRRGGKSLLCITIFIHGMSQQVCRGFKQETSLLFSHVYTLTNTHPYTHPRILEYANIELVHKYRPSVVGTQTIVPTEL